MITMLGLIRFYLVIYGSGNAVQMRALSSVPCSAVMGMPVRVYPGDAPVASLVLLAATTAGVVALAALVYERSVLRTAARGGGRGR